MSAKAAAAAAAGDASPNFDCYSLHTARYKKKRGCNGRKWKNASAELCLFPSPPPTSDGGFCCWLEASLAASFAASAYPPSPWAPPDCWARNSIKESHARRRLTACDLRVSCLTVVVAADNQRDSFRRRSMR